MQPKRQNGAPRANYTPTQVQFPAGGPGHSSACREKKQNPWKHISLFPHLSRLDPNRQWQSDEEYLSFFGILQGRFLLWNLLDTQAK